ncbi:MAG: 1-acyl-sn-glycerol-3-phosphate acyltransferase [Bacteroidota bacterium]
MDKGRFSKAYYVLKAYCRFTLRRYYRKYQVVGHDTHVTKGVPIIFAPNHQNALIDPINAASASLMDRQPSFLTRSDVFVSWAIPFFNVLKMKPIYRQRDGVDSLEKNKKIFEECVERLSFNESLIIFPEGNHGRPRKLRPLKKGAARIAFQAAEANQFEFPLELVPVGLNYNQHRKFHNDMLVVFGESIPLSDYYELYHQNSGKAILQLTKDLRKRISKYMVHIMNAEHYDTINDLRTILSAEVVQAQSRNMANLHHHLLAQQDMVAVMEAKAESDPESMKALGPKVQTYMKGLQDLRFRDHVVAKAPYSLGSLLLQSVGVLLGLPLHLYGVINNYHIYKTCEQLTLKIFKDDHFHSSVMFASGMVLFPLSYLIQFGIVWGLTDIWVGLLYLISLPLSGEFAVWYSEQVKKWWSRWRHWNLKRKQNPLLKQLTNFRQEFSTTILSWLEEETQERVVTDKK